MLALLLAATLAGVVHLSRRIGGLHRAEQASIRDLRIVVDQLQRRVVGAVEKERLAAGDRHQELIETIARTERLTPPVAERLLREQNRDIESMLQLFQQVTPRAPMPVDDPVTPTDLLGLMHMVRSRSPKLAVVLGPGPSTVWLGYALEQGGRLVVVDHDAERAAQTRALLLAHGLTAVEVLHAPLAELSVEGRTVDWYDVDALDGLQDIDLLVVDGPAPEADRTGACTCWAAGSPRAPRSWWRTPGGPCPGRRVAWATLPHTRDMAPVPLVTGVPPEKTARPRRGGRRGRGRKRAGARLRRAGGGRPGARDYFEPKSWV